MNVKSVNSCKALEIVQRTLKKKKKPKKLPKKLVINLKCVYI